MPRVGAIRLVLINMPTPTTYFLLAFVFHSPYDAALL